MKSSPRMRLQPFPLPVAKKRTLHARRQSLLRLNRRQYRHQDWRAWAAEDFAKYSTVQLGFDGKLWWLVYEGDTHRGSAGSPDKYRTIRWFTRGGR